MAPCQSRNRKEIYEYGVLDPMKTAAIIVYKQDLKRYEGRGSLLSSHALRFLWVFRNGQRSGNPILKLFLKHMMEKYGLEISPNASIGEGLYLGHAFNITVNPAATIGANCNLHKGVTIGQENRGKRKGAPRIGDSVWIGANSTIVGNIAIGNDVLIAPNTYVNCDVPSHSVVFGNPCVIKRRDNATEGYINSKVALSD